MNYTAITKLIDSKSIALNIEAGITLNIRGDVFRPGTVRVHLPAPINAGWLKEGQLLDSDPMFRMASVEDYPQRSVYYNERLEENTPFSVKYAFTSEHLLVTPDIDLINSTDQKHFDKEAIERFSSSHHCGCESYTALPAENISITDVIEDRGIRFLPEYFQYLKTVLSVFPELKFSDTDSASDICSISNDIVLDSGESSTSEAILSTSNNSLHASENVCPPYTRDLSSIREAISAKRLTGSVAHAIYRFITENFTHMNRHDHNLAYVSMCRMCGIPARWQGGWAVTQTFSSTPNTAQFTAANHDWAMVHLLPYGWIYVDCAFGAEALSENLSYKDMKLADYFFGNIDPFMVPTASVPEADLYPAKDYERADKTFNVYGEAELVPDKMGSEGHFEGFGLKQEDFSSRIYLAQL